MPFDVQGARAAGYTDVEIANHLASEAQFDIAAARKAGYSESELIGHLSALQSRPASVADTVPVTAQDRAYAAAQPVTTAAPAADPTLADKLVGAGETALTLATGATGGTLGMIGGTAKGIVGSVMDGTFGTQEGVRQAEQSAAEGMGALTYQPRTETGQDYAQTVGEVAAATIPASGLTAELSAAGRAAGNAAQAARNTAPAGAAVVAGQKVSQAAHNSVQRIRQAAPEVAGRVERILRRTPEPTQAQRTGGSVGAAGVETANLRRDTAESLPVPIDLTEGQATRDQMQVQFERETAKLEGGGKLRDRYAEQNEKILQNFDAWIDQTGAEAPSLRAVGQAVDSALVAKAKRDKTAINVAYKAAEKAGELESPVTLSGLVEHLNESAPDAATAPLLNVARSRAIQLGIAAEDGNGNLVAVPTTLKNAERMRQAIGRATDYEATNIRQSAIIKGEIDAGTASAGGQAYKTARRMRENYAKQYEDRAVIASLLNKKKGMADRKIALEDVFSESILKGSLDDVRHVRRVLQTGGEEGSQAWRELQGATMTWLRDEATRNVATDVRGNTIVSADKLNKAIRQLDADGKLDFIFGKKGAENVRDINEIVKLVYTAPPGSVNTSSTAATLLAALGEAGASGALVGLPVPVLTTIRFLAKRRKDAKLQAKIDKALARRPRPEQQPNF